MDLKDIENNLGKFPIDGGKILNEILNLQIKNNAMLSVLLGIVGELDNTDKADELAKIISKKFDEISADVMTRLI